MNINDYQQQAARFCNPEIPEQELLLMGVMGLCGESGEAVDLVKKVRFHGHPLDRDALIRELGDVAWYLACTASALDVSLEEVLTQNLRKLQQRYPDGFSSERSLHRSEASEEGLCAPASL